ncbi:MAG: TonB-dependent receptor [Rhodoblastus sp.]
MTSDTASLFSGVPGMSVYSAGGFSGLPAIHGLADDRLRIKVDGMDILASCPNHMNPALSYIDPSQVASARVWAGVAPVSVGGDSIGGTISVDSAPPVFAATGQPLLVKGDIGVFYRSNGVGLGGNFGVKAATGHFSLSYAGVYSKSENYRAGGAFRNYPYFVAAAPVLSSNEVGSTAFRTVNNKFGLAYANNGHLVEFKGSVQSVPRQLYPNQRMDMLKNDAYDLNLHYAGTFDWGDVDARIYHQHVYHYMDFGQDKLSWYGNLTGVNGVIYPVIGMPMYTRSRTTGATAKAGIKLTQRDLLRVGLEAQTYRIDDWWPPSPNCGVGVCAGGMAPLTFWNINNGKRDRIASFAEWEAKWTPAWTTILGARFEHVMTDAGPVSGYTTSTTPLVSMMMRNMYETSSVGSRAMFNAMDRSRNDNNVDLTGIVRYAPNRNATFELGLARKVRSPGIYERYSWSRMTMAAEMNNSLGDGNAYLGNPYLKPEAAYTASFTIAWQSDDREFELRATPYYTYVHNFIDAVQWNMGANQPAWPPAVNQFVGMKYMNQNARLFGVDLSGKAPLAKTAIGDFGIAGVLSYTNGKNLTSNDGLYNIMPLNGRLSLTHKLGGWSNAVEFVGVAAKDNVSDARNEWRTPHYALINLRTSYTWENWRVSAGVENLFDKLYYLPLGGAYVGEGATMSFNKEVGRTASAWGTGVPGPGRSFYLGANYTF